MTPRARLLCNPEAVIGESPYATVDGTILWVDPIASRLLAFREGRAEAVSLSRPVWSVAGTCAGGLVGNVDDAFCAIDLDGTLRPGPPAAVAPGCRFNDMAVDPEGGLWAGTMHKGVLGARGALYHATSIDARPQRVFDGLGVPNGMACSADARTLYVIDTLARTLLAFAVEGGRLGEPLIVTDFLNLPGKPDGMTMAPDGSFWVAMWGGGCVVQIAPYGATVAVVPIPAPHVSSVCLVDDTLFATTSRMRLSPQQLAEHPDSGGLFAVQLAQD